MITILIYSLFVIACFQPNKLRFAAAVIFAGVTVSHELLFSSLDGLAYYGSAALLDLLIIILISRLEPVTNTVLMLNKICLMSILANLTGWTMWFFYYPPTIYDVFYIFIYAWALFVLIKRDSCDVGSTVLDSGHINNIFDSNTRIFHHNKHKG